eukprot:gene40544-53619_t
MVDFMADKGSLSSFPDRFSPYVAYGVDWSEPFNGTLFRLPLRTSEQRESSLLSKKAMGNAEAQELLE